MYHRISTSLISLAALVAVGCGTEASAPVVGGSVVRALQDQRGEPVQVAVSLRKTEGKRQDLRGDVHGIAQVTGEIRGLLLRDSTAEITHTFETLPSMRVELRSLDDLDALVAHPGVERVDLDMGGHGALEDDREAVGVELLTTGGIVGGTSGLRQKVAIVDTGINSQHRSFKDPSGRSRIVDQACFCSLDLPGDVCCPDDDDPTDDVPGHDVEDDWGHGSHVAGIVGSNGRGSPQGMAPLVDFVVVRVMNENRFRNTGDIVKALNWLADNHPDLSSVNMSLGTSTTYSGFCDKGEVSAFNRDFSESIDRLRDNGTVVVVSSGNDGKTAMQSPACLSNTISVGNADTTRASGPVAAGGSNRSAALDIFAPGTHVVSADKAPKEKGVAKAAGAAADPARVTRRLSGTSMAAGFVAGAVALVRQLYPKVCAQAVEACLRAPSANAISQDGFTAPLLHAPGLLECVGQHVNEPEEGVCADS